MYSTSVLSRLQLSAIFPRLFAREPSADLRATRANSLYCFNGICFWNCDCCTSNYRLRAFLKRRILMWLSQPHLQCLNTALSANLATAAMRPNNLRFVGATVCLYTGPVAYTAASTRLRLPILTAYPSAAHHMSAEALCFRLVRPLCVRAHVRARPVEGRQSPIGLPSTSTPCPKKRPPFIFKNKSVKN